MKNLTLENITKVCGGVYFGPADKLDQEVSSITTDSRKIEAGSLFVPIVGERVDAHKFIPQVMEAGALATLSERTLENADFPYIKVESSLQAVKDIAEFYLKQLSDPGSGNHRKRWQDQHQGSDRVRSEGEIPYSENPGKFQQ